MAVLVVAEFIQNDISKSTLSTISAALLLQQPVTVLVAGNNCAGSAQEIAKYEGVTKVLLAESTVLEHALAESISKVVCDLSKDYVAILAPATTFGKNFMPRVAATLNFSQISDIISVVDPVTFKRPIYAGNAIETVKSLDTKQILTVRPTAFSPVSFGKDSAPLEEVTVDADKFPNLSKFISKEDSETKDCDLATANRVVSGGRGLQSKEQFLLVDELAGKLGAAVGATRAAVDAGFVPNDYQVGQTGKIVAPDLYVAVGISGAIQHLAGMKDSKVIVAINQDPDAPIFEVADYGLVGDLFEIVPELIAELS